MNYEATIPMQCEVLSAEVGLPITVEKHPPDEHGHTFTLTVPMHDYKGEWRFKTADECHSFMAGAISGARMMQSGIVAYINKQADAPVTR